MAPWRWLSSPAIRPTIPCCRHPFAKDDSEDTELAASIGKKLSSPDPSGLLVFLDKLWKSSSEMCHFLCHYGSFRLCSTSSTDPFPRLNHQNCLAKQQLPKLLVMCQKKLECCHKTQTCFLSIPKIFRAPTTSGLLPTTRSTQLTSPKHEMWNFKGDPSKRWSFRAVGTTWLKIEANEGTKHERNM